MTATTWTHGESDSTQGWCSWNWVPDPEKWGAAGRLKSYRVPGHGYDPDRLGLRCSVSTVCLSCLSSEHWVMSMQYIFIC